MMMLQDKEKRQFMQAEKLVRSQDQKELKSAFASIFYACGQRCISSPLRNCDEIFRYCNIYLASLISGPRLSSQLFTAEEASFARLPEIEKAFNILELGQSFCKS